VTSGLDSSGFDRSGFASCLVGSAGLGAATISREASPNVSVVMRQGGCFRPCKLRPGSTQRNATPQERGRSCAVSVSPAPRDAITMPSPFGLDGPRGTGTTGPGGSKVGGHQSSGQQVWHREMESDGRRPKPGSSRRRATPRAPKAKPSRNFGTSPSFLSA
jgi:hypothetical protein